MNKVLIKVEGMTCAGCSAGLEKHLNKQNGIIKAEVSLIMNNAAIEYDDNIIDINNINSYIKEAGFKSLGKETKELEQAKIKKEKLNFIFTIIMGIVVIYISMAHMFNIPQISYMNIEKNPKLVSVILAVITTIMIILSFNIIKNGIKKLVKKIPNMDSLISMGVITSYLYSLYSMILFFIKGSLSIEKFYFESVAMVLLFTRIGRYIDSKGKKKAKEAITRLVTITPSKAYILVNGKEKKVSIDEINKGDIVICRPGEKIAVDGKVVNGITHIDESFITGESLPSMKKKGDVVLAGTINYDGYIEYVAEKIGRESTVSEIVRIVAKSLNNKSNISRLVDKICYYFVPAIIAIAVLSSIIWILMGQTIGFAINILVSVLVVSCPCALGLATPMAIVNSSYAATKNGILIKNTNVIENANKIDTVVFDKTGTITKGRLSVSEIVRYSDITENGILQIIGSVEKKSEHPIAKAIVKRCNTLGIKLTGIRNVEILPGLGVRTIHNKKEIVIGSKKLMEEYNVLTNEQDNELLYSKGNTIIYLSIDGILISAVGLKDAINDSSKDIIKYLKDNNIETIMLTGDNKRIADIIAEEIGIDSVISNVLPSQKADKINELRTNKKVMMVGDGINDAPSLVNADIGVSIERATDVAKDSSDVVIMNDDLMKVATLLKLSKKTKKIIKQNLFWAFIYNVIMVPVAGGMLYNLDIIFNPMYASISMTISSIFVILNSFRLRMIRKTN